MGMYVKSYRRSTLYSSSSFQVSNVPCMHIVIDLPYKYKYNSRSHGNPFC